MNPEERKEIDSLKTEIALFQLNQMKKNAEFEKAILNPYLQGFETRIKTLEEARQRQIELNKGYSEMQKNVEEANKRIAQSFETKPIREKWWW